MKKITSVVFVMMFFLTSFTNHAQSSNTTVAVATNVAFAPLEKNSIPNNMLLGYGMELIDSAKTHRYALIP